MHRLTVAFVILVSAAQLGSQTAPLDLVIRNGRVIDGTGAPAREADVGVRDGRIVSIGRITETAKATIDAKGLVVAPGFIDVHTHVDEIATQPAIPHFVRMGVTTVVAGNCGSSAADVATAFTAIEAAKPAINYATLIGHNTVRREAMGTANRQATADELKRMEALVAKAMTDGAVGFSTGLQYVPGECRPADRGSSGASAAAPAVGLAPSTSALTRYAGQVGARWARRFAPS